MADAMDLRGLVGELAQAEQLSPPGLVELQSRRLAQLVGHHARHTPVFTARLKRARLKPADISSVSRLRALPTLSRREIQQLGPAFSTRKLSAEHLPTGATSTSGSTGEPVTVRKTRLCRLYWGANGVRDHRWHQRDATGRLLSIRATLSRRVAQPGWGFPLDLLGRTGPALGLPVTMDLAEQIACVDEFQPQILLTFPNVLAAMIREWERRGAAPSSLCHLRAVGETVHDELRVDARRVCGLPVEDHYSSQECGIVSIQCPASGLHHEMAESVIVEVLDAGGNPCEPGQMGRLIITDLNNFASPMIRYEIGDIAVRGEPCACGRPHATLARVVGRDRNLLVRPDGNRRWPTIGFHDFHQVAQVAQFRFIQHSLEDIELIVYTTAPLQPAQLSGLAGIARRALDWHCPVRVTRTHQPLPRSAGGKFEDFVSKVIR